MITKREVPARMRLTRELGQSLVLLALTGSFTGGVLGMLAIATRALGR
jgi:hypothetical protein